MIADIFPSVRFMSSKWKKAGRGSTSGHGTRQGKLRRIFQGTIALKSGISLGFRRNSPTKESHVHATVAMIEITSSELRETIK